MTIIPYLSLAMQTVRTTTETIAAPLVDVKRADSTHRVPDLHPVPEEQYSCKSF